MCSESQNKLHFFNSSSISLDCLYPAGITVKVKNVHIGYRDQAFKIILRYSIQKFRSISTFFRHNLIPLLILTGLSVFRRAWWVLLEQDYFSRLGLSPLAPTHTRSTELRQGKLWQDFVSLLELFLDSTLLLLSVQWGNKINYVQVKTISAWNYACICTV